MAEPAVLDAIGQYLHRDDDMLLKTLSRFPAGVTIVATRDKEGVPHGLTATSFTSVSLHPPLVTVCVANSSRSILAFQACDAFGVSLLAGSQQLLAETFSSRVDDKFSGVAVSEPLRNALLIDEAAGTLACSVYRRLVLGDHLMLVGRVVTCSTADRSVLAYGDRRFMELGG
ncbi:putative oxidoreductase [metagenome]|uniref:Putative oxidoreductase n=1 Tax=metagenome TaxID=256318 RepID=A0A2P2C8T2_9ZZZZ